MGTVRFDYGGALTLAATLWRLADDVEALATARESASVSASADWEGRYGAMFDIAGVDAVQRARAVATTLRSDAVAWARAWATAMDDQNEITYQREANRVRTAHEAEMARNPLALPFLLGLPRRPGPVAVPSAPSFGPTAVLAAY